MTGDVGGELLVSQPDVHAVRRVVVLRLAHRLEHPLERTPLIVARPYGQLQQLPQPGPRRGLSRAKKATGWFRVSIVWVSAGGCYSVLGFLRG